MTRREVMLLPPTVPSIRAELKYAQAFSLIRVDERLRLQYFIRLASLNPGMLQVIERSVAGTTSDSG